MAVRKLFILLLLVVGTAYAVTPPRLTPPQGTYSSLQVVFPTCPDGNTDLYYTTDGSTPTTLSTLYTSIIQLSVTTTLKISCYDGVSLSTPTTAVYTFVTGYHDTTLPNTPVTLGGATYHLNSHPRMWLDGASGALTLAMSDATNRNNSSNPYQVQLVNNWNSYGPNKCGTGLGYLCLNAFTIPSGGSTNDTEVAAWAAMRWLMTGANPSDTTYLPAAKWAVQHVEDALGGSTGCDETVSTCGAGSGTGDFGRFNMRWIGLVYTIVRQYMTPDERKLVADKILNGNPQTKNGLGGTSADLTAQCVNEGLGIGSGTISVSGNQITSSVAQFNNSWVGMMIKGRGVDTIYGRIKSVQDSTHATLSRSEPTQTGKTFYYSRPWQMDATGTGIGNCGLIWWFFHVPDQTDLFPGQEANFQVDYPPLGGSYAVNNGGFPNTVNNYFYNVGFDNKVYTIENGEISLANVLGDDDVRARNFLSSWWDFYYKWTLPAAKSSITGFNLDGPAYSVDRNFPFSLQLAIQWCHSLVENGANTPCNLATVGTYLPSIIPQNAFMERIGDTNNPLGQDSWAGYWQSKPHDNSCPEVYESLYMFPTASQAELLKYVHRQGFTNCSGQDYVVENYIYGSPAVRTGGTNVGAPFQYMFRDVDYALCIANPAWTTPPSHCWNNRPFAYFVSLSGFTGSDIRVLGTSGAQTTVGHQTMATNGHIQISTGLVKMLYWDPTVQSGGSASGTGPYSNTISVGGNFWSGFDDASTTTSVGYANISRWAGLDPTGDSNNKYTYALLDLTPAGTTGTYMAAANATRVNRHFIHFKDSRSYIVIYDDVATSVGNAKKAYWHFMSSDLVGSNVVTINTVSKSASVVRAGAAQLQSQFLSVDGNANHIAMINSGSAIRSINTYTCPSLDGTTCDNTNSAWEEVMVNLATSNTALTMPTVVQPTVTAGWTSVQINDATFPKVAVIARQGATPTSVIVTTTHSGTAQYVVAGLAAGTYNVSGPITLSNVVVPAGDTTLSFSGTAGTYSIAQGTPALTITTVALPDGFTDVPYSQTLTAINGTLPYTWSLTSGSMCSGLTLASNGVISGITSTAQSCSFTVKVTDAVLATDTKPLSINIVNSPPVVKGGTMFHGGIPYGVVVK